MARKIQKSDFQKFLAIAALLSATAITTPFVASECDAALTPMHEMTAMHVDRAQLKRNMKPATDKTSKFCRLLESKAQNYRIDVALESFHTMNELIKLTGCSEARIKSHVKYVRKNCADHCRFETADKKFRFVTV